MKVKMQEDTCQTNPNNRWMFTVYFKSNAQLLIEVILTTLWGMGTTASQLQI